MSTHQHFWLTLACALTIGSSPAFAEHGHGHGEHGHHHARHFDGYGGAEHFREHRHDTYYRNNFRFDDHHRHAVNSYYGPRFRAGRCPPGLIRHDFGCAPPGVAGGWAIGRPLPRGTPYYGLPRELAYRLPPPPFGERYVRVGADILLIAPGTSMVIDIMPNIGGY